MSSENTTESETSYRHTYSFINKLLTNLESKNQSEMAINFSTILDNSDFEARIIADIDGYNIDSQNTPINTAHSNNKSLTVIPNKIKDRSILPKQITLPTNDILESQINSNHHCDQLSEHKATRGIATSEF